MHTLILSRNTENYLDDDPLNHSAIAQRSALKPSWYSSWRSLNRVRALRIRTSQAVCIASLPAKIASNPGETRSSPPELLKPILLQILLRFHFDVAQKGECCLCHAALCSGDPTCPMPPPIVSELMPPTIFLLISDY